MRILLATLMLGSTVCSAAPSTIMVQKAVESTVMVRTIDTETLERLNKGTGVLVSGRGYILTAAHILSEKPDIEVLVQLKDGLIFKGEILAISPSFDLAILKIDHQPKSWCYISRERLTVGTEVIAIGHPWGIPFMVSEGIISGWNRGLLLHTALINPGNSGGPLFNSRGELIGINVVFVGGPTGTSLGYGGAVDNELILRFLKDL